MHQRDTILLARKGSGKAGGLSADLQGSSRSGLLPGQGVRNPC